MNAFFRRRPFAFLVSASLCLSALFSVSACGGGSQAEERPYIVSIEKADGGGYTVVYSDGSSSSLAAEDGRDGADGKDGQDGADLTVEAVWEAYVAETGEDITLAEFIERYLELTTDDSASVGESLLSCVSVYAEFVETQTMGGGFFPGGTGSASQIAQSGGSGVIYKIDGDSVYIVTNYHVVYDPAADEEKNGGSKIGRDIYCYLYGSESAPVASGYDEDGYDRYEYGDYAIECEYIGGSLESDIAVLRAEKEAVCAVNENVRAVTLAEGHRVGESVYAIGNAEGEGITATAGIVSVDSEYILLDIDEDGTDESYRSIRFDASIYHGNSGGGLFNAQGELIGIANAGIEGYESICYAIPVSIAEGAVENILYHYNDGDSGTNGVYKIETGAALSAKNAKYVLDESGYGKITEEICVESVEGGSVAETMGLAAGDTLTAVIVGGVRHELDRTFDVDDLLLTLRPGDALQFVYERGGAEGRTEICTLTADMFVQAR